MTPKRQLAAIMFTDIAGYTAMMQQDEQAAANIRRRHREVFQSQHEKYRGEILQYYGDGTLSIFQSAVDAMECAIAMQQAYQGEQPVPVRIGLHLGDIVYDQHEVYGDGVNLASRIETLGVPGCILLSDKVNFAVKNQGTISTCSLGHFEFKNIQDPVEVFAACNPGLKVPQRSELKGKLKENKKSIAVLPFVNMSSDAENEYFSDGIAEEILNALVRVAGLQVTARTSSWSFKGKDMDVREIGRQLGVAHLLEGSVRKAGNRVRITAQLVSTLDGYHFFSETYDRTLDDIFGVQDEIAQKITNRLRQHLGKDQHQRQLVEAPTTNIAAYEQYLRGLYYYNQYEDAAWGKALAHFQQAIELEPGFTLPRACMAISYMFLAFGGKMSWEEAHEQATEQVKHLQASETETPETFWALFIFQVFFQWDWQAAWQTNKRGLELFPNDAHQYHALSILYFIQGDLARGTEAHKKGWEMDPLNMEMLLNMAVNYLWMGNVNKAQTYLDQGLKMVPNHRAGREVQGWIHAFQGQYEQALSIFENLDPPLGYRLHRSTCLGWVYYKMGQPHRAQQNLEELKIQEAASPQNVGLNLDLATLCTCMGEFDKAFRYLEKAVKNKVGDTMMCRCDILLKPLQTDPRFREIEELIGSAPEVDFGVVEG